MLGRTLLVSGGRADLFFIEKYLKNQHFDTVVCADSGLETAYRLHLPVQYFMGDFDSVSPEVLDSYRSGEAGGGAPAKWVQYPREKDFVDTQLVLEWILEQGAAEIVILGATGGRMDHFLANVHLLALPLERDVPACIIDECNRIRLTRREMILPREELFGKYISLLPLTGEVTGVTLEGFYYPLENAALRVGFPRAISNELADGAGQARITLAQGILIVIESKD